MNAHQLIRLYPRAWRERYGDEFVDVIGDANLSAQQTIDILAGAADAWMSPTVRASVRGSAASASGGATLIQELKLKCATTSPRYTTRDGLISAGVLIAATIVQLMAGIWLNRNGYHETGEAVKGMALPVATLVSMPFAILKGQSRRVQMFFILVPMAMLIGIGYLSTRI